MDAETYWNEKQKATQVKSTIQLEEINQKFLTKEGRLKFKTMQTKKDMLKQRKNSTS